MTLILNTKVTTLNPMLIIRFRGELKAAGVRSRKALSDSYADDSLKAKGSNHTPKTQNVKF